MSVEKDNERVRRAKMGSKQWRGEKTKQEQYDRRGWT